MANLAFFAIQGNFFGHIIPDGREPERIAEQISPEKLHLLPADVDLKPAIALAPPIAQKPPACAELGSFIADDAKRAETQLDGLGMSGLYVERRVEEQPTYMVYLPPFKTKADADRAAAELHRIGVNDFFIMQDNGPYKLAISLGVFRTEEAAKAQLTTLSQQGVRNAKTGERPTAPTKMYLQFRNADQDLDAKLVEFKSSFPGTEIHDCPAGAASSSGT